MPNLIEVGRLADGTVLEMEVPTLSEMLEGRADRYPTCEDCGMPIIAEEPESNDVGTFHAYCWEEFVRTEIDAQADLALGAITAGFIGGPAREAVAL